ncbi:TIGR01777 family oxidoreductase [Yonghaparkia sp. Soil809]|uniref:TIGR01777 family oxidoreductase n=1 Tax=Yonghaparkia sp. Soil809 TaxID=1736417 RepID=UPI000B1714A5|nr:TIGR01777 family oxidoreductase [Yonghaparkia sp. Soil809]
MAPAPRTGRGASSDGAGRPLTVLIAGASGMIGSELQRQLRAQGHAVRTLVRRPPRSETEFAWSPESRVLDARILDEVDAVVNLSGASISRIPWTPGWKRQILDSRIGATRALAEAMGMAERPPATFISGSAVGYYGDRPAVRLTEESSKGEGFLADVVEAWEQAAQLAPEGTRVVLARTGLVIGPGGAMTPLRLLTRFGLAARVASGGQHWPWISLHDEAGAIVHLLTSGVRGPVNLAGPTPATSDRVTRALAAAMNRPNALVLPERVIALGMGEAGRELLLASQKMVPAKLIADGFRFRHETIEQAIAELVHPEARASVTGGRSPAASSDAAA